MNNRLNIIDTLSSEYKEIYDSYIMPVDTNVDLKSVILSQENQEKFKTFITEQSHKDQFLRYGLNPMNRILMYGASGTGKTLSSRALANELGLTMLTIDIAKALSDETVSKNISEIFKLANYLGHCLIFLDECDAIAWQRDTGNSDTGTIRRATNSLFQHLDQMNKSNVFVSATNMLHRLDNAFERRFDLKLEFRRPQLNLKDAIQRFILPGFVYVDDVDRTACQIIGNRAMESKKLSYYEIQGIVERAMKNAIIRGSMEVRTSECYDALSKQMNMKLRFKTDTDDSEIFTSNIDKFNS